MGLRLSASKLSHALQCGYPFRPDLEIVGEPDPPTKATHTGTAFALLRDHHIAKSRFGDALALPELPPGADRVRANQLFEKWLLWWWKYSAKHPKMKWESEVPLAFDPTTGKARRLHVSEHREYIGALPHEIVGTADLIGTSKDEDELIVLDDKTGRREYVDPAATNAQLRFLSLCVSTLTGTRRGKVGLVFPHLDPILDEVSVDGSSFDAARVEFAELPARIASAKPHVGDHCHFCPLREEGCWIWEDVDKYFLPWQPFRQSESAIAVSYGSMVQRVKIKSGESQLRDVAAVRLEDPSSSVPATSRLVADRHASSEALNPRPSKLDESVASAAKQFDDWVGAKEHLKDAPMLHTDFERIVDRIYRIDAMKEYDRLETSLRLGEKRTDRAAVHEAVDDVESNARTAYALYLAACLARTSWEADAEITMAHIRNAATNQLQREKDSGQRSKQITDADVRSKMANLYPDEFAFHEKRSAKIKGMEEQLKRDADIWMSRCASVRSMLDKVR
jgi:hypothetical protein